MNTANIIQHFRIVFSSRLSPKCVSSCKSSPAVEVAIFFFFFQLRVWLDPPTRVSRLRSAKKNALFFFVFASGVCGGRALAAPHPIFKAQQL